MLPLPPELNGIDLPQIENDDELDEFETVVYVYYISPDELNKYFKRWKVGVKAPFGLFYYWECDGKAYVFNSGCHGSLKGQLLTEDRQSITPRQVKSAARKLFNIKGQFKLILSPCFPNRLTYHYAKSAAKYDVEFLDDSTDWPLQFNLDKETGTLWTWPCLDSEAVEYAEIVAALGNRALEFGDELPYCPVGDDTWMALKVVSLPLEYCNPVHIALQYTLLGDEPVKVYK